MSSPPDDVTERVLERVRRHPSGTTPVVVFDIDSTLLDTSRRHLAILDDFLARIGAGEALVETSRKLHRTGVGWSVVDDFRKAGVADRELLEALGRFWRERFFAPAYMTRDIPVPGAPAFVRACHEAGAWCYYLTARVLSDTEAVTRNTLRRYRFPLDSRTTLAMKPARHVDDHAFKFDAMERIAKCGEVVAAFDNDPANINMFHARFPGAICVLMDTVRAPDSPPPAAGVLILGHFRGSPVERQQHSG